MKIMKAVNAIKRIEKHLAGEQYQLKRVTCNDWEFGELHLTYNGYITEISLRAEWQEIDPDIRARKRGPTDEEFTKYALVDYMRQRRLSDKDDSMSDYCAGWFPRNLKQALEALKPPKPKFEVGQRVVVLGTKRTERLGCVGETAVVTQDAQGWFYVRLEASDKRVYSAIKASDLQAA